MTPGETVLSAIGGSNKEERVANVLVALSREGWAFVHMAQIGKAGAGPVGEADQRLDSEKAQEWPAAKKALWKVVTGENLNDGHYINAYRLTDKLYAALSTHTAAGAAPVEEADAKAGEGLFLIRKRGAYYRPNEQGYTSSTVEAGRYSRADAERITHPNGSDGPRDGMDYVPAPPASTIPSEPEAKGEAGAGPVGEAVVWQFEELHVGFGGQKSWHWRYSETHPGQRPDIRNVQPLYARPGKEPGEAERLRAEGFALAANQCRYGYGDEHGHHRCAEIDRLTREIFFAKTALVEARERLEKERDAGFNHGYLMAVANIINLHRETVVATDVLLQIDLTIDDAESFELAEYDMEALNRLRAEPRAADFFKSQRREGDAQEAGR